MRFENVEDIVRLDERVESGKQKRRCVSGCRWNGTTLLSSLVGLERKCKTSLQMVHYCHLIGKDRERREDETQKR